MRRVQQRFAPRPVTLVIGVALVFAAVLGVAQSIPAAAQATQTPSRPAATATRPAATRAPVRPAATRAPVRPPATVRPAPARPGMPSMPRAGGGGMATSFVDSGNGSQGLWFGLVGLAAVGGAGALYARRLRTAHARVLLH